MLCGYPRLSVDMLGVPENPTTGIFTGTAAGVYSQIVDPR